MDSLFFVFAGTAVFLLVVCLITRESTEGRLRGMRVELMALRSKERTLEEQVKSIKKTGSQIREGLMRMERTQDATGHIVTDLYRKLEQLYEFVRKEPMPPPKDVATTKEKEQEVVA